MVKSISSITSSLLLLLLLWSGDSWGQTTIRGGQTTILGGGSDNVAEVSGSALSGTEKGLVIRCASGCAGSGGTSQADNSAVSSLTGIGALYDTTPPAITDGNVGLPVMDSSRRLIVNCGSGCSGSSFADNAAFTFGTTTIQPIAGVFDDTGSNTASENSAAVVRITTNKGLHANLRNASGTEIGTAGAPVRTDPTGSTAQPVTGTFWQATQPVSGTFWQATQPVSLASVPSHAVTNAGTFAVQVDGNALTALQLIDDVVHASDAAVSKAALAGCQFDDVSPGTTTENSVRPLRCSTRREAYTQIRDAAGNERGANVNASNELLVALSSVPTHAVTQSGSWSLAANQSTNVAQINGVTPLMGAGATGTGALRTNPVSSSATGAAPPTAASFIAGLGSGATGGFLVGPAVGDTFKPISVTSATTTLLVTGVSGRHVRITSLNLVSAIANNVALISGTGATCGTGTAGIAGGTTAANGWNLAANGGLTIGTGLGAVMQTVATGDSVCVVTSAIGPLAGSMGYAIY